MDTRKLRIMQWNFMQFGNFSCRMKVQVNSVPQFSLSIPVRVFVPTSVLQRICRSPLTGGFVAGVYILPITRGTLRYLQKVFRVLGVSLLVN